MITLLLAQILAGVVLGLAATLPTYSLDLSDVSFNAQQIGAWASALNGYVPVVQLGLGLALLLGAKVALLLWQAVVWIYHQFWGSN